VQDSNVPLLAILIAIGSFLLSLYTLWLTQFHRGRVHMTRPTLIFMARETDDGRYKIFLRTHLFATSPRGRVIENMYVRLRSKVGTYIFDLWGYGEADKLSLGSGLFVGQAGVTYNHHFVLRRNDDFIFWDGDYHIEVFASVVGNRHPVKLTEIDLLVGGQMAAEMVQIRQLGAFFEWDPEQELYTARVERRDL
jgi:hypothetical protein